MVNGTIRIVVLSADYVFPDTDGDGVRDSLDYYPEDASRAMMVRIPDDGSYYTVAYEDLYPKPGDMDFNDFVVKVRYEQDLNAKGESVRLRSFYQHIAKGAGYNHTLHQKIPGLPVSQATLIRYGYPVDGVFPVEFTEEKEVSGSDSLHIFSSKTSISQSNTNVGGVFKGGKQATIEYIFSQPVTGLSLGRAPYDLYLYVINTNKEIHFAGLGYEAEGKDLYLDSNGFPWALMISGKWYWPYESGDIHAAYTSFSEWYMSFGIDFTDWYKTPVIENVFPY
jgi:LruC domain-containing protein